MASFDAILEKIKKNHADSFKNVNLEGRVKRFRVDSPQLNFIFGGGFAKGRIYEFYGPESSGKSTICTYLAMQNQLHNEERPVVVYMDFERTFDVDHAIELGLDTAEDKFIFLQPLTGEEGFQVCKDLIEALPVGLIVWDSIGTTPSAGQMADFQKASFGGTANVLSSGLKYLNPYLSKYETSLVFVNQERAQIGGFSPIPGATSTPGGFARKFYSSSRNRITKIDTLKDKSGAIGIQMKIRNIKSKIGNPFREGVINLYFQSGIDSEGEYLDFIVKLLCERKGAWYNNEEWGMHVQGQNGVSQFLKDHPDIYEAAKVKVNDILCQKNTALDKDVEMTEDEAEAMTEEEASWANYMKEDSEDSED